MNRLMILGIVLSVLVPFSGAAARDKLVAGDPAPSCLERAPEQEPSLVMSVFLRGLF